MKVLLDGVASTHRMHPVFQAPHCWAAAPSITIGRQSTSPHLSNAGKCGSLMDILVLDRPQQLQELGCCDVLVVGRQQSIAFNRIVFATMPARLCAIESPITPGK